MAFELVLGTTDSSPGNIRLAKTAVTAMAAGDVLAWNVSSNALERATSSSTTLTVYGVCVETRVAADTNVLVCPFGPMQVWRCDVTNTSATTQIGERAALTDQATLNNSDSDVTGTTGVFRQLGFVGATTDKKMLVQPLVPGMITA